MSVTRRAFLAGLGGAGLSLGVAGCRARPRAGEHRFYEWSGIGFGIGMSMEIHGVDEAAGEALASACRRTIAELEQAFSLYLENSELRRLNRDRVLSRPSPTFLELLDLAIRLESRTLGYCQPAIHGAWEWLGQRDFTIASGEEWRRQCEAANTSWIEREADGIVRLTHPLTQLSMNAIGQGYLADRVACRLREAGVERALLHLGETVAIGGHPAGRPWKLAVMGTGPEPDLVGEIELVDCGLAVSANEPGRLLIDPVGRGLQSHDRVAAVSSREGAVVADAFATAFAVAPAVQWPPLLAALRVGGPCRVRVWEANRLALDA